jgi:3'-phosphoadenosine 5'-phosphosulfate (PAPS) 3'-phosphatase
MELRASARAVRSKSDGSPVTQADLPADEIIRDCLRRNLADLPVITEETYGSAGRVKGGRFVLVEKEFVRGSTEFTVNIALVESGIPLAGAEADVYPRLAPTMEWDTAAGHAVLLAAGGVVNGVDGNALRYGKPGYRNPAFVAWGSFPAR